jgi:hypothetical protein
VSALTGDRNTPRRDGVQFEFPVAAGVVIYAGALVALESGLAYPGAKPGVALTGTVVGVAEARADNSDGGNGDIHVRVRRGVYRFANPDAMDLTVVGEDCFVVDDQTVGDSSVDTIRAGTVRDIDPQGVWVEVGVFEVA